MLEVKNVTFSYPLKQRTIIADISFDAKNEIIGIVAPTGAGKTTLLNIVSGLLEPNSGTVRINGLSPKDAIINKKIGFSFQDSTLLEWKTVIENVLLPLEIGKKKKVTEETKNKAIKLIRLVGLEDFINYKCSELSGGMKQRVGLARALMTEPEIIFFDEPFNKLDFVTKKNILIEFRKILKKRNISSLVVTHDIEDAVLISDKILVLSNSPCTIKKKIDVEWQERTSETLLIQEFSEKVLEIKKAILSE